MPNFSNAHRGVYSISWNSPHDTAPWLDQSLFLLARLAGSNKRGELGEPIRPRRRSSRLQKFPSFRSNTPPGTPFRTTTLPTQTKRSFVSDMEHSHGRQLRRFLSSRLRHGRIDAPDLVQEVFLRLLRIKDHEAIRNPQAYLYTVASHVLHQHSLEQSARPETMDPLEIVSEVQFATAPDPADVVETEQRLSEVGRALEQVSPRAYAALVMYRCEGMTLQEIGDRLGVSHVMVRKYLARAIAYCDERMEAQE